MKDTLLSLGRGMRNAFVWIPIIFGIILLAGSVQVGNPSTPGDFLYPLFIALIFFTLPLSFLRVWNKNQPDRTTPHIWHIITVSIVALCFMWYGAYKQTHAFFIWQDEQINESFANLNVLYQKRFNVVTNSAVTVNSFAEHEKEIMSNITSARKQYIDSASINDRIGAINDFEKSLRQVNVTIENYPALSSSELYQKLLSVIKESDEDIATAKRAYNNQASTFNKYARTIPYTFFVTSLVEESSKRYVDAEIDASIKDATGLLNALQ